MRVVADPDPLTLERELLRRLDAAHAPGASARSLVIVPTARLAAHVQRRLLGRRRAWVGVSILHFRAAAAAALESAGRALPAVLAPALREALIERALDEAPDEDWSRFVRSRPGAIGPLRAAFDALRESGALPAEVVATAESPAERGLGALFERYVTRLEGLAATGSVDEAGFARAAAEWAAPWARRFGTILVHGAYELIGIHLNFLRALDRGVPVVALVPFRPGSRATAYAERFAGDFLARAGTIEPVAAGMEAGSGLALDALYDETARPAAAEPGRIVFRHAQGAGGEVGAAVRSALSAVDDGVAPEEIAIVARSLEPYAGALESALADEGLAFATSLGEPLLRSPLARDFSLALRVADEAIAGRIGSGPCRFGEHAARLRAALDTLFEAPDDRARTAIAGLLDTMAELETLAGDRSAVPFSEVRAWLDRAIGTTRLARPDEGGIRVLDVMQARGQTFRRVLALGWNASVFPQRRGEDPFVGDGWRRRLRERCGRPIPLAVEGPEEERLLVTLVLGASSERVEISWQRADESGRSRAMSLALREAARLHGGEPDLAGLRDRVATLVPSHPREALSRAARIDRCLSPREARVLAAFAATSAPAIQAVAQRFPELAPGLAMLLETERFEPGDGRWDARIGPEAAGPAVLSVSDLQILGLCPLRYYFARVLGVHEPDREDSAFEIDPRDTGVVAHAVLESLYRRLAAEGHFVSRSAEPLADDAAAAAAAEARVALELAASGRAERLPVLWGAVLDRWVDAIARFVALDLRAMIAEGRSPEAFEATLEGDVELGDGRTARVRGRIDRRLQGAGGPRIGDYKSAGRLESHVDLASMLKGESLQAPLYAALAGEGTAVEFLGVGPSFVDDDATWRVVFSGFENDDQRRGFRQTLGTLVSLVEQGRFPLRPGRHCDWCPFTAACRRHHPPTLERDARLPGSRELATLAAKSKRKPLADG